MADIEQRVDKLEEKVDQLEKDINSSLGDIKGELVEIKGLVQKDTSVSELKIDRNTERIRRLEDNQTKVVWVIIGEVVAIVTGAVKFYLMSQGGK